MNNIPDLSTLRRLRPLAQFTVEQLQSLANQLDLRTAKKGELLLPLGSVDDYSLFVTSGEIETRARDGVTKKLTFSEFGDLNPVAQLRPCMYDVKALGKVQFLKIDNKFLTEFAILAQTGEEDISVHMLEEDVDVNQLTIHLYEDMMGDKVSLPSMSEAAQRIQAVFSEEYVGADKVAAVLMTDPAISAKMIRVANSPVYQGVVATVTIQTAIVRLGMNTTFKLVMAYAVNELFNSRFAYAKERMKALMAHSRKVSAISRLLAKHTGLFDPEQAMLAGLIHDLGVIVVVEYLQQQAEQPCDPEKMEKTIQSMRSQIGGMLMRKWNFSKELIAVAEECEDWFRNPSDEADLCDLIIVAQYLSLMGMTDLKTMPPVSMIPAMAKLKLDPLESIDLIRQSNKEIREVEALFS